MVVILSGCRTAIVKVTRIVPCNPKEPGNPVQVFKQSEPVSKPYEIIGVVSAYSQNGDAVAIKGKALKRMQTEAANLGADALVGYYEDIENIVTAANWASALAVRFVDSKELPKQNVGGFLVAIPHVLLTDTKVGNPKQSDKWGQKLSQLILTQKGYYATIVDESVSENFLAGMNTLEPVQLDRFGGAETDLVLGIQFVKKERANIILIAAESNVIEFALYSKSRKNITWTGQGSGTATAGWIINMVGGIKEVMSINAAAIKGFHDLPAVSTETKTK